MSLLRNKWYFALIAFLFTTPAWAKSFAIATGIFTETGQLAPHWWQSVLTYSACLIPLDALLTVVVIYYFGKGFKGLKG